MLLHRFVPTLLYLSSVLFANANGIAKPPQRLLSTRFDHLNKNPPPPRARRIAIVLHRHHAMTNRDLFSSLVVVVAVVSEASKYYPFLVHSEMV